MEKTVRRRGVLNVIRGEVSPVAYESIKRDLKNPDWYAVGDGRNVTTDGHCTITIEQSGTDPDQFRVVIEKEHTT